MNNTDVHAFYQRKYNELLQSKRGRIHKKQQMEVLHREICMVYQKETWKRPHVLLEEIETQIC